MDYIFPKHCPVNVKTIRAGVMTIKGNPSERVDQADQLQWRWPTLVMIYYLGTSLAGQVYVKLSEPDEGLEKLLLAWGATLGPRK